MPEEPRLWSVVVGGARANAVDAPETHRWTESPGRFRRPRLGGGASGGELLRGAMARGPCSSAACWTHATRGCPWRSGPEKSTEPVGGHQRAYVCLWRRPLDDQRRRQGGRAACGRLRRGGDGGPARRAGPAGPRLAGAGREDSQRLHSAGVRGGWASCRRCAFVGMLVRELPRGIDHGPGKRCLRTSRSCRGTRSRWAHRARRPS